MNQALTIPMAATHRLAVLIPCLNEAAAIGSVVGRFRRALPHASVHVYDNGSTDGTAEIAREAGAIVHVEPRRGKGNVVRRMFADIDADLYILIDGDDTYDVDAIPGMIDTLVQGRLDMVTGKRVASTPLAYRAWHGLGNRAFTKAIGRMFGSGCDDVFSGLRVMTRRLVKSFPALAKGFEIETDLTVHALALRMAIADVPVTYSDRPAGSESKLRTYRDGLRIALRLQSLLRAEKPFIFFGALGALACTVATLLAIPLLETYLETGFVPRFPTAILSTGLMLAGFISLAVGIILQSLARFRHETLRLNYLSLPEPPVWRDAAPVAGRAGSRAWEATP